MLLKILPHKHLLHNNPNNILPHKHLPHNNPNNILPHKHPPNNNHNNHNKIKCKVNIITIMQNDDGDDI